MEISRKNRKLGNNRIGPDLVQVFPMEMVFADALNLSLSLITVTCFLYIAKCW